MCACEPHPACPACNPSVAIAHEAQQARLDAWRLGVVSFAARPPKDQANTTNSLGAADNFKCWRARMFTIAGLILLLAGSSWFSGAHTVGVICLVAGLILEVLPLLAMALFAGTRVR